MDGGLLEIDLKSVVECVEQRYGVRLPRRIVMVDYGEDVGDCRLGEYQSVK